MGKGSQASKSGDIGDQENLFVDGAKIDVENTDQKERQGKQLFQINHFV